MENKKTTMPNLQPVLEKTSAAAGKLAEAVKSLAQKAPIGKEKAEEKTAAQPAAADAVFVQYGTKEFDTAAVAARCKAAYRAGSEAEIESCTVYLKPEEATAYYVINGVSGKLDL